MEENKTYEKIIAEVSPYYAHKKSLVGKVFGEEIPANVFKLSYSSSAEGMEQVYFWLLDFMDGTLGGHVEKIADTFQSTVGSGHFSELMGKATRMQEEGMKVMQTIGVLIKSVINIIYDLKQFEIRLNDYKIASGKDPKVTKESGIMALKQTWLDNVDIKRGNSSMKAMTFSQQGAFVTLLNAFFMVNSEEDIKKADLNEIVKRLLSQRLQEFLQWKDLSEIELRKRYDIERHWLKSQVDSLNLYSKWATPYFEAAESLRQDQDRTSPDLVNAFNSIVMKLILFKCDKINIENTVNDRDFTTKIPRSLIKLAEKEKIRSFFSCNIIEFRFRGIPTREGQHYSFGGRTDVVIRSFGLNEEEVALFKDRLKKSELTTALKLAQSVTQDSLKEIEKDIEYFTKTVDERDKTEEKKEENKSDVNPFSALLGFGTLWGNSSNKDKEKTEKEEKEAKDKEKFEKLKKNGVRSDNYYEKILRNLAELKSKKTAFTLYDVYKKSHGMGSIPIHDYTEPFRMKDVQVEFLDLFKK